MPTKIDPEVKARAVCLVDNALMETINGLYKAECVRPAVFHASLFLSQDSTVMPAVRLTLT
jgi:hypothetical protein